MKKYFHLNSSAVYNSSAKNKIYKFIYIKEIYFCNFIEIILNIFVILTIHKFYSLNVFLSAEIPNFSNSLVTSIVTGLKNGESKNKPKKRVKGANTRALAEIKKQQRKTTVAISKIAFTRYVHINLLHDQFTTKF